MNIFSVHHNRDSGQTLIETMVGIFIMVMGITAALGLANYALHASTQIQKQVVGIGLAREGMEAVKNMRDTNWLNGTITADCGSSLGACYQNWLTSPFSLGSGTYQLSYNSSSSSFWSLQSAGSAWALDINTDPSQGLYRLHGDSSTPGSSGFYRKITITPEYGGPFAASNTPGPRIKVTTQVWWIDKNCPASIDWPGANKCSVQLQTYLTNWRTN